MQEKGGELLEGGGGGKVWAAGCGQRAKEPSDGCASPRVHPCCAPALCCPALLLLCAAKPFWCCLRGGVSNTSQPLCGGAQRRVWIGDPHDPPPTTTTTSALLLHSERSSLIVGHLLWDAPSRRVNSAPAPKAPLGVLAAPRTAVYAWDGMMSSSWALQRGGVPLCPLPDPTDHWVG